MRAFLFPGQGARNVLGGLELARTLAPGSGLVDLALEQCSLTFDQVTAEAGRALERTEVLQPLLTAAALSVYAALEARGSKPGVVLGHSLGEIAAASAAGAFDARTAVRLAAARGRLMARESSLHPGGLFAATKPEPGLELAAVNAPDEWVMGGPLSAMRPSMRRLDVSGAWHTAAMRGAVDDFAAELARAEPRPLQVPMVSNLDGEVTRSTSTLAAQLAAPVQLVRCFERLLALGVDEVVTVGPGLVLRGLVRKNLGSKVTVRTTEDRADLEAFA